MSCDSDTPFIWCLATVLFGLSRAIVPVSLFGRPTTIFYMMLAFTGAMPVIVATPNSLSSIKTDADLLCHHKSVCSFNESLIC